MPGPADASGPSHTSAGIASDPLAIAAIAYAKRGWRIFPLRPWTKLPYKGSHGHLDATSDPDAVARMWAEKPGSNIGLATGDLIVVDLDGAEAVERWALLAQKNGGCPPTLVSKTPRGFHLFFTAPPGTVVQSSTEPRKRGAPGIDIKGHGGYVVLPPSRTREKSYTWTQQ